MYRHDSIGVVSLNARIDNLTAQNLLRIVAIYRLLFRIVLIVFTNQRLRCDLNFAQGHDPGTRHDRVPDKSMLASSKKLKHFKHL